jgi:hypothetical protein
MFLVDCALEGYAEALDRLANAPILTCWACRVTLPATWPCHASPEGGE